MHDFKPMLFLLNGDLLELLIPVVVFVIIMIGSIIKGMRESGQSREQSGEQAEATRKRLQELAERRRRQLERAAEQRRQAQQQGESPRPVSPAQRERTVVAEPDPASAPRRRETEASIDPRQRERQRRQAERQSEYERRMAQRREAIERRREQVRQARQRARQQAQSARRDAQPQRRIQVPSSDQQRPGRDARMTARQSPQAQSAIESHQLSPLSEREIGSGRARPVRQAPSSSVVRVDGLNDRSALQRAFVLKEVLDRPIALRPAEDIAQPYI